mgnify:CR=1 FL=1
MHINIAWQDVDTVLLDMDGTLLDLAFDNYFWQKLVPETWGAKNGVTPQEAMEYMRQQYHDVQHTLTGTVLITGVSNWVWISVR